MSSDIPDHIIDSPDVNPVVDPGTLPVDDPITDAGAQTEGPNGQRMQVTEMVAPESQASMNCPTETIVWRYSVRDLIDEFCWGCVLAALAVMFHVLTEENWKAIGEFLKKQLEALPSALNHIGKFLIENPLVSGIIAVAVLYWVVLFCIGSFRKKSLHTDEVVSTDVDQATVKKITASRPVIFGLLLTAIAVFCVIQYNHINIADVLRWGFDGIVIVYWVWLLCIYFMRKHCTLYTLTPTYFELQHGFIFQKTTRISLADIEQVNVIRTLWERVIGTGTIQLRTKDQTNADSAIKYQNFRGIRDFLEMQKKVDAYRLYFRTQVLSAVVRG